MSYCINCGVELDDELISCPLCGYKIGSAEISQERDNKAEHYPSDIILLHKTEKRKQIWELSGIIALAGITVCTIVNLVIFKNLTWSLFADTAISACWICLTLVLMVSGRYFIILPGLLLTILSMLFLFDFFTPPIDWFIGIALPVTIALFVASVIIIFLWMILRLRGLNILAIAFLILSGFCIVCEIFIDKYSFDKINIHWSAIVAISIFPISLVLFFVHYRLQKGKNLNSYFHV